MPAQFTHWAKTSEEAIQLMESCRENKEEFELASFDHDLGWDEQEVDLTSRAALHWIVESNFWPAVIRFHTANFIAHKWLRLLARDEAPETTFVDLRDPWNDDSASREFGLTGRN